MRGPDDMLTSHRIDVGLTTPDVDSRAGAPGVRGGTPAGGPPVDHLEGVRRQVRPHAVPDVPAIPDEALEAPRRMPGRMPRVSPRLFFGILSGLMATGVTLLAIPTLDGWAIAPVLGVLAGALGWLAADATWGPQPPTEGGGSRW